MNEEETPRMKAEELLSSPSALHRGPDLTNTCKTPTAKHTHSPTQSTAVVRGNEACPQAPAVSRPPPSEYRGNTKGNDTKVRGGVWWRALTGRILGSGHCKYQTFSWHRETHTFLLMSLAVGLTSDTLLH